LEETGYQVIVFHNYKAHALQIQKALRKKLLRSVMLNAEQSQQERIITFDKMRLLKINCIVATDLIARGVDLPDVQLVVNFDVPPLE
jgi:ATP-dependent RNA helicase RhlE